MSKDLYYIGCSSPFNLSDYEAVVLNMSLEKYQKPRGTLLRGRVQNKERPIGKAIVQVMDIRGYNRHSTLTNKAGYYEFENSLRPGKYRLIVSHNYYKTSPSQYIKLIPKVPVNVDVELERIKEKCFRKTYGIVPSCDEEIVTITWTKICTKTWVYR